ncbi:hypothetical protein [Asticcacaulis sp. AC402]|uniref:hypothetical protein n=1 Tax=Asticcacaulis sp. AC402 TaxID=1282361 RepID=UPI0012DF0CB2|nr:hypothetical protein [Asticcacaulis sp. AC402]
MRQAEQANEATFDPIAAEAPGLRDLLAAEGMLTGDLHKPNLVFWSLSRSGDVIGFVGRELCGDDAL